MRIAAAVDARRIRVTRPFQFISLKATATPRVTVPGTTSTLVDRDANLSRDTGATTVTDYAMQLSSLGGVSGYEITWESSNPAVATVDSSGRVTHVSNGSCVITASARGQSISRSITLSTATGQVVDTVTSYVTGSLARNICDAVDTRLAGKSAATALRIFTTQNHATQTYVRNPSLWCADLDLTCNSPWNSHLGAAMAGTLVSPLHPVFAWHFQPSVNSVIRFVKMDGTVVNRTLVNKLNLPGASLSKDITVGLLDSPVPEGVTFAKILPENWATKIPALSHNRGVAAFALDQEEKGLVRDWVVESAGLSSGFASPTDVTRLGFYESIIGGDSGNPAFLIIDNQLVLLTVWTYGGGGSGTSVRACKNEINAAMTALGGGYQLTEVDLSAFPSY